MRICKAKLRSQGRYSQGKHVDQNAVPPLPKEAKDDYEVRTWRERCNVLPDGTVFIPPMAFKKSLDKAASFLGEKIPGKRNATYTKHFLAGVLVQDPLVLPTKKDTIQGEWLFVPADGKPGGNSRVSRCFPYVDEWAGEVTFYVVDDTITPEVFERTLREAGNLIGIGRFRPERGGFYGRFKVESTEWVDLR